MKSLFLLLSLLSVPALTVPVWAQTVIIVHVLDPKNAPVAGASVEVQIWRERSKAIPPQITGVDGAVTLELPAPENGKPVQGGVSVAAPGFAFNNGALKGENMEIHLQPGVTWRGKVMDEAGKPVEGASVRINRAMLGNDYATNIRPFGEKNSAAYTSKSAADGSFAIKDVPAKMGLQWVIEHPDYALKNGSGALAEAELGVKLAPGGALKGRVLDLAGKPLANVMVYASISRFDGGNEGKTDADGAYTIKSLAPGIYNLGAYAAFLGEKPGFVLPRVSGVGVEVGKTGQAPEMRAIPGVVIEGLVRDAATQKPLEGASVYAQNEEDNSISGESDKKGHFTLRVALGSYKVNISGVPDGYLRPEQQKSVVAGEVAAAPIIFDLNKATILHGTIVDEAGKPLQAKLKVDYDSSIESDAKGEWKYEPQSGRKLQLAGGDTEDGYFEVVSPKVIEVAAAAPTTIVLRKLPWRTLPGRALTTDGKPLEGAQIEGNFYVAMGDGGELSTSTRTATSNANGDFALPQIRGGIEANYFNIKAKKPGFAFQKGGEVSKNGPVLQLSDLVFTPLNLQIAGKTTPGARVTVAGVETLAGADGKFRFDNLPATTERVWAFKGSNFGGAATQAPVSIELKAQEIQPRDPDLARDIWNDIIADSDKNTTGEKYWSLDWVRRHAAATETTDLAAQLEKTTGDMPIMALGERAAKKVPLAALETAFGRITNDEMRVYAYLSAAAKSGDKTLAARALKEADAVFQTPEKDAWWRETNLYRAAGVAPNARGEEAGIAALDRAVAYTLKNHGLKSTRKNNMPDQTGRDEMMALGAESVAPGGVKLMRRLIEQIEPGSGYDVMALGNSIPILAQNVGVESVLPLLDELAKMPEPEKREENSRADQLPQYAFAQAAVKIMPLLGAGSPQKALDLARRVRDENYGNSRKWQALAGAAKFQSGEGAAKLWREIVSGAGASDAPRYAAQAFELDPQLGRELFEIARQKAETEGKNEYSGRAMWAGFAFYSARANPAQARFILEREWGLARQKKTEGDELGSIALAMAALDAPRAWQMAREIPGDSRFSSFDARRKIGVYLAASDAARRDFPFGQNNYEEWRAVEEGE